MKTTTLKKIFVAGLATASLAASGSLLADEWHGNHGQQHRNYGHHHEVYAPHYWQYPRAIVRPVYYAPPVYVRPPVYVQPPVVYYPPPPTIGQVIGGVVGSVVGVTIDQNHYYHR